MDQLDEHHEMLVQEFIDYYIAELKESGIIDKSYKKAQSYLITLNGYDPLKFYDLCYVQMKVNMTNHFHAEFIDGEAIAINIIIIWLN